MNIIYILSLVALIISFMLLQKNSKKLNVIAWIIISIIIYMAFNATSSLILSFLRISNSLLVKSILNLIVTGIICYFVFKKKKKQEYYFRCIDLVATISLLILIGLIVCVRFGSDFNIIFETTDPSVHHYFSKLYADNNILLGFIKPDAIYGDFSSTMFFGYVNLGTLINVFKPLIGGLDSYKVYILFEAFVLFISAALFYFTITIKNKKKSLIVSIICLGITGMFMMGYPLNNMLFGFFYLGLGVLLINLLLYLLLLFDKKNKLMLILSGLVALNLFFTYYYFVPAIFFATGIYFIYLCFIKKELNFKELVKIFLIVLIVPFIIGMVYFFVIPLFGSGSTEISGALVMEGYIYRNLFANFIFLIPFVVAYLINTFRKKEFSVENSYVIIMIIFTLVIFILGYMGKASSYYYFKSYFALWLLFWVIVGLYIYNAEKEIKVILCSAVSLYALIVFGCITQVETKISEKNILFNPEGFTNSLSSIYLFNYNSLKNTLPVVDNSLKEIILYAKNNNIKNSYGELPYFGDYLERVWIYSITGDVPIYEHIRNDHVAQSRTIQLHIEDSKAMEKLKNDPETKYFIYKITYENYDFKNLNQNDYEIVFQRGDYYIAKKR